MACRPDLSASSLSLHSTLEVAAMTRSLPEQEVLKYLAHGHPLPTAEGSSNTTNTLRYAAWLTASVCSARMQLLPEAVPIGLFAAAGWCASVPAVLVMLLLCDALWLICKFAWHTSASVLLCDARGWAYLLLIHCLSV